MTFRERLSHISCIDNKIGSQLVSKACRAFSVMHDTFVTVQSKQDNCNCHHCR